MPFVGGGLAAGAPPPAGAAGGVFRAWFLLGWTARLQVEDAFFQGGHTDSHVVGGGFGGVEACGLPLGMAMEGGEEVGFDSPREFLRSLLGGLNGGLDRGGKGFHGFADVLFCGWLVRVVHGRGNLLLSVYLSSLLFAWVVRVPNRRAAGAHPMPYALACGRPSMRRAPPAPSSVCNPPGLSDTI